MSVVGIDIGSQSLRAVEVGDPGKPHPTLLRYHEVDLPQGAVNSGEVVDSEVVVRALKQLWAGGGFKTKNVVLGVGNQRVLARDLSVPKASLKRIRESLPFEVQEMLPVPVADALLDFYPISEAEGEQGPVVHGLLIAAVKDAVLGNVRATELAGLTTVEVDLIPFALNRVMLSRPLVAGTVALVDIGAGTTCVVIATDGVPQFVRIIPTGGSDINRAMLAGLDTDAARAEATKRRLGLHASKVTADKETADKDGPAAEIIFTVASDQLASLRNTINYFVNTRPQNPVTQILLTGGGSRLNGLPAALADMTRLTVTMADPFSSVSLSRKIDEDKMRGGKSNLAVALGLALGSVA